MSCSRMQSDSSQCDARSNRSGVATPKGQSISREMEMAMFCNDEVCNKPLPKAHRLKKSGRAIMEQNNVCQWIDIPTPSNSVMQAKSNTVPDKVKQKSPNNEKTCVQGGMEWCEQQIQELQNQQQRLMEENQRLLHHIEMSRQMSGPANSYGQPMEPNYCWPQQPGIPPMGYGMQNQYCPDDKQRFYNMPQQPYQHHENQPQKIEQQRQSQPPESETCRPGPLPGDDKTEEAPQYKMRRRLKGNLANNYAMRNEGSIDSLIFRRNSVYDSGSSAASNNTVEDDSKSPTTNTVDSQTQNTKTETGVYSNSYPHQDNSSYMPNAVSSMMSPVRRFPVYNSSYNNLPTGQQVAPNYGAMNTESCCTLERCPYSVSSSFYVNQPQYQDRKMLDRGEPTSEDDGREDRQAQSEDQIKGNSRMNSRTDNSVNGYTPRSTSCSRSPSKLK